MYASYIDDACVVRQQKGSNATECNILVSCQVNVSLPDEISQLYLKC